MEEWEKLGGRKDFRYLEKNLKRRLRIKNF
jgi:hypothetical protein